MSIVRSRIVDRRRRARALAIRSTSAPSLRRHRRRIAPMAVGVVFLALFGARAATGPLAYPPAGAQGIHRVHLPRLDNRETLPGHAAAPGPLLVDRAGGHTLTRLEDGRLLVVGGSEAAEVWDPRDRRSRLVDPLSEARSGHVAVRLLDGRVLVAGGELLYPAPYDDLIPLASALVFDPATETWQPVPPMASTRRAPAAAMLPDGRVLVAGGEPGPVAAEVFLPDEDAWRAYPAPPHRPAVLHALPDGRVLALHDPIVGYVSASILDPSTARWAEMPAADTLHTLGAYADLGSAGVLVVFGLLAERFDAAQGRWRTAALPPVNLFHPVAAPLPDGSALFAGNAPSARAYRYDPRADRWSAAGTSEHAHSRPAVAPLADGRLLLAGGNLDGKPGDGEDRVTELFDPASGEWTASWPASQARGGHTATVLPSGALLLAGGKRASLSSGYTPRPAVLAPDLGRWVASDPLPFELTCHAATALDDGRVLVTGGSDVSRWTAASLLYDPATRRWRATADMAVPRAGHASVRLLDGSVLVAGNGTAERFDPATERWQPAGTFEPQQESPGLVRLDDGRVLMVGGRTRRSVDRYDPATGQWRSLAPLPDDRDRPSIARLPDASILVAGGYGGFGRRVADPSAYRFDPRAETWSRLAPPSLWFEGAPAFTLPDGSVLIVGGCCAPDVAERYDPTTDTWRLTGRFHRPRYGLAAAQRPDGTVIVNGGCCDAATGKSHASSEWYDAAANAWRLVEPAVVVPSPGVAPLDGS